MTSVPPTPPQPTRERVARKAKDRAVEHLHEITSTYYNKSNNSQTAATNKRNPNRSSYKHFADQTANQSDDESELNDQSTINNDSTPRKSARSAAAAQNATKRKNVSSREATIARASSKLAKQQQQQQHQHTTMQQQPSMLKLSANGEADLSEASLYNQILSGQASMQSIVDDWIESYKKEKETAMLELIQFLVRSSGCKGAHLISDKELLKSKEFIEPINDLIEYFNDDETGAESYPLVQNSLPARRFKANFCEFLQLLVNQCQFSIIYDQFMLDILITFLIALADSQVRAFRHTSTLAVLKIMTALVDVLLALSISKDAAQRQYENERQKSQMKRANDRIEMLINKRKEIEENEYEIQNFINFIFKAVFIHRYRDICADIRCVCINEIGEWMKKCPSKFLDDTFLKYIGWTLYDKVGECRIKCLQALQPLYDQDDLLSRLELFTSRFKSRIVEMSLDKEFDVSCNAIKLLTCIVKQNDAALEDKECENIYELVYHTNRQIAQAAGEFLKQKLFVKVENPPIEFRRGKKQSENSNFIQLLVQFLIESELHDHPAYLVDAMWEIHPMLKDWECMTDLLLEDPVNPEDGLDDIHERFLIEIIACCVKQAATGEYPIVRRTQQSRKLTSKELKQVQDDRALLTQHFIVTLPTLLTKYVADAEKLVYLLQIPSYFELNQYSVRRQEKNLEKLLQLIQEIVTKHNDSDVLDECSKCLAYMCDEDSSIYSKCNIVRSSILDDLVNAFTSSMKKFDQQNEADENEMYPLMIALKRLSAFAVNHNIANYDIVSNALTILKWAVYNDGFGHDFVNKSLNLARSLILWNMQKLEQEISERNISMAASTLTNGDGAASDDNESSTIKELVEFISKLSKKYYKLCNKLFVNDNAQIKEEAFFELSDLLILFNPQVAQTHKEYKQLVMDCPANDINILTNYVVENAFADDALSHKTDTPERIEKLHKRRCILTSFSKLICYNCVPIKYAADIFRGYIKYSSSYGDIIKHLLATCRDISRVVTAKTIVLALQREFNDLNFDAVANNSSSKTANGVADATMRVDRSAPEFTGIRELARRFCLSFGPDASVRSREAIVSIHQEALKFVSTTASASAQVAPLNLPFLEIVAEFTSRLTPPDKRLILAELDKCFAKRANKLEENCWQPYYTYRMGLMDESGGGAGGAASSKTAAAAAAAAAAAVAIGNDTTANTGNNNDITVLQRNQHSSRSKTPDTNNISRIVKTSDSLIGGSAFKDTTNNDLIGRQYGKLGGLDEDYEDEENELNQINTHADTTAGELGALKLNSTENTNGRPVRRAGQQLPPPPPPAMATTSGKRSRSPLVSNNSINESMDHNNILTSTRIETSKLGGRANAPPPVRPFKSSITITRNGTAAAAAAAAAAEAAEDDGSDGASDVPLSKRKRKSEENEEKSTSIHTKTRSGNSVYV